MIGFGMAVPVFLVHRSTRRLHDVVDALHAQRSASETGRVRVGRPPRLRGSMRALRMLHAGNLRLVALAALLGLGGARVQAANAWVPLTATPGAAPDGSMPVTVGVPLPRGR